MAETAASEVEIENAVARADRARRGRDAAARLWRIAPIAAAVCLVLAVASRLRGWTPWVSLLVLAAAALALSAYVLAARRHRRVSDGEVSHIDADAGLQGELRSAHWFVGAPDRDDWIHFHLARAAERVRAVDWAGLYPAPAAGRAKIATGVLALAAIVLAVAIPGRAGVAASGGAGAGKAAARKPGVILALPADVRKQIEDLLTAAESGDGRALTAGEVRALLAKLDELARNPAKPLPPASAAAQPPASEADIKAFAERAKKASESTALEPEVRDALSDVADKLGDKDQNAAAMSARDPQDAAAAKGEPDGPAQPSKTGAGNEESSVQSVKEAAGGSGVGVVMMTNQESGSSRDGGQGLGGGSMDRNGGGHLAELGAALRRETIDANADLPGENVLTEERRKTERATATTAYSHAAAAPAERGSSTAPPPVPESRRAAVKSYFIRKK